MPKRPRLQISYYSHENTLSEALANAIEKRIKNEELKPKEKLPTTKELSTLAGVGLVTASQAYKHLKERRLVVSHQRHGMFVSTSKQEGQKNSIPQESISEVADRVLIPSFKYTKTIKSS